MEIKESPYKEMLDAQVEALIELLPEEMRPQVYKDYKEAITFRRELVKESDRGLALLGVGRLDALLQEYLEFCLIGSKSHFKEVFSNSGPLATFSSRIKLGYSMGLISKNLAAEIHVLREIRNLFAHHDRPIDFESLEIDKICRKLKFVPKENDNRQQFISVIMLAIGAINNSRIRTKPFNEIQEDYDEQRLKKLTEGTKKIVDFYISNVDHQLETDR